MITIELEPLGRTHTDEYAFTKLALLLLRHRGLKMASTAGIAPAASTFAQWRSDLFTSTKRLSLRTARSTVCRRDGVAGTFQVPGSANVDSCQQTASPMNPEFNCQPFALGGTNTGG